MAARINQHILIARKLLRQHREIYPQYWKWSDNAVDHAVLYGWQSTVFGWVQQVAEDFNHRSLRNFHMQANGAEMLRLAICMATEAGIQVCAPVHDAVLIQAPESETEEKALQMQVIMNRASSIVTGGFELRTEIKKPIYHPSHFYDKRGAKMYERVMNLIKTV